MDRYGDKGNKEVVQKLPTKFNYGAVIMYSFSDHNIIYGTFG